MSVPNKLTSWSRKSPLAEAHISILESGASYTVVVKRTRLESSK